MTENVYIVIHEGPSFTSIIGVYRSEKDAEMRKINWDKEHPHIWDATIIITKKLE